MRTTCKRWTEEERELLRQHYSTPHGVEFLLGNLKRTRSSLWLMAQRMKLPHYQFFVRGAKGIKGNKGEGAHLTIDALRINTTEDSLTGCWNWNGGRHSFGYGKIMINRKTLNAHRVMFVIANPSVNVTDLNVNHRCDNPGCINPDHLYAGTQRDNVQDQVKRGRHRWQRLRKANDKRMMI